MAFIFSTLVPLVVARRCAPNLDYDKMKEAADDSDDDSPDLPSNGEATEMSRAIMAAPEKESLPGLGGVRERG
eukprot:Skav223892  [mRNA]  locus=scaffold1226:767763:771363:- [translate_table: standard]